MSSQISVSSPVKLGDLEFKNRVFMASLTRNRSPDTLSPNDFNVEYYAQRARSFGLIFTEAALVSRQGSEWPYAPGIWSEEQVENWKKVTDAVHKEGGKIFIQLWHLGRIVNNDMPEQQKAGKPGAGPSAILARGGKYRTLPGVPGHSVPVAIENPKEIVAEFKRGAEHAKAAGFDGADIHGANGYVIHQFLDTSSNQRTDEYGGSVENRARLALEIVDAVSSVFGPGRVDLKLAPGGGYNDMGMPLEETIETYTYLIKELIKREIAMVQISNYLDFLAPIFDGVKRGTPHDVIATYGPLFKGTKTGLINNGGITPESAKQLIGAGAVDAVSFGQLAISNPDLAERIEKDIPVANPDYQYLYWTGDKDVPLSVGYSDYPVAQY